MAHNHNCNGEKFLSQRRTRNRYSPEGCIATVLFVVLIGVIMLQVTGRIGIFRAPIWTEELARWLWVWMALVAVGEVERGNAQLRMEFIADLLPPALRLGLYRMIDLIFLGVTVHLLWIAWKTVRRTLGSSAVTLPVPDAVLYGAFCVAASLILLRVSIRLFRGDYPRSGELADDATPAKGDVT